MNRQGVVDKYAMEKLYMATSSMIINHTNYKNKLKDKIKNISAVRDDDFPEEWDLRKKWKEIFNILTSAGTYDATIYNMTYTEAEHVFGLLFQLLQKSEEYIRYCDRKNITNRK
jgi:hypothetical protein